MRDMLIDCHTHAYPVKVAEKLIPKMVEVYGIKPKYDATVAGLLDSMKSSGVDKSIILTVANRKEHVKSSNTWCIEVQDSCEKLMCFGSIHLAYPDWELELERLNDNGIRGIKLQPNAQRFYPDDEKMNPIYEKLMELDMSLVFHVGDEVKPVKPMYAAPKHFQGVLDSYPELNIMLAHLGGYKTFDEMRIFLDYDNLWFDTAFIPGNISDKKFIELVDEIGDNRVVYGSDFPWADPAWGISKIRELFGDKAGIILEDNPGRFFSRVYP